MLEDEAGCAEDDPALSLPVDDPPVVNGHMTMLLDEVIMVIEGLRT